MNDSYTRPPLPPGFDDSRARARDADPGALRWVSFYRPEDVRALLGLPEHVVPVAWLCIGYPDERPARPGLEAAGWERRRPLEELVYDERWGARSTDGPAGARREETPAGNGPGLPGWWREHRSAEPAHQRVLLELGLEPLLDLRLRLGEGSGAALALPLVGLAGRLHSQLRTFDEAGVEHAPGGDR